VIIIWQTLSANNSDRGIGRFHGNSGEILSKKLYLAIKTQDKVTPIGTASCECIDLSQYSSISNFFWEVEHHSEDIIQATYALHEDLISDGSDVDKALSQEEGSLHIIWDLKNTLKSNELNALCTYFLSQSFSPYVCIRNQNHQLCKNVHELSLFTNINFTFPSASRVFLNNDNTEETECLSMLIKDMLKEHVSDIYFTTYSYN
jgi:hypothetical protein